MSVMMCDACSRSVDTDHREVFEVQDSPGGLVWVYCEPCLMGRVEGLTPDTPAPFLVNGKPGAEWIRRNVGE